MARYVVTGGCGFIGSHLVDALINQGHQVIILDNLSTGSKKNLNKYAELVIGDICDSELVTKTMSDCDGCFHLAAVASVQESVRHWVKTNQTNLVGTITLLDIAKNINKKHPFAFVYASSAAVYGENLTGSPFKESDVLAPISPYGADKLSCEIQASIAGKIHQLPNTGLRFFNVYGERQNPASEYSGVISILVDHIKKAIPFSIFGDGEQMRDYIYVKDVVMYLCQAMHHASTASIVYNVCHGNGTTINQLVKYVTSILNVNPEVNYAPPRRGDIRVSIGDNTKIKSQLLIPPPLPLYEGLKKLAPCTYPDLRHKLVQY